MIYKCMSRYLFPYFMLCTVNLGLEYVCFSLGFKEEFPLQNYIVGIIYSRGTAQYLPDCSPLWFLTCLFCAMVLFNLIHLIKNEFIRIAVITSCVVISAALDLINVPKLPWNIDTALMAVFFIELGYNLKKYLLLEKKAAYRNVIFGFGEAFLLFLGLFSIHMNESVDFDGNSYGNVFLMVIGAVTVSLFVIFFCRKCLTKENHICRIFAFFGKHTIFIMGFDYFIGNVSKVLLIHMGVNQWDWFTLFPLKTVLISIGILIWTWSVKRIPNDKVKKYLMF